MHEQLKKFWKDNDEQHLLQPMTAWFDEFDTFRPEPEGIKGFIFEDHIGLQNVKDIAGEGLYVYAMRHGDDERDWHGIFDWSMDWGDEYYWE